MMLSALSTTLQSFMHAAHAPSKCRSLLLNDGIFAISDHQIPARTTRQDFRKDRSALKPLGIQHGGFPNLHYIDGSSPVISASILKIQYG
ncbi:hypothetical protein CEXT_788281 [Caerostris extrusa]|uniref:Uncharacterized protein n=1 Tax=Caerostris extrusa TaxID=172846 RepID=A0AAV4YBW5_CAEEX|nr:hypothetical protein CEXT_788281 [Caerostris extrusa]